VKNKVFWNTFIRASLQSYLKMIFTVMISIDLVEKTDESKTTLSNGLAITVGVVLLILPVFYAIVLHVNRHTLSVESVKKTIGSLYLGKREDRAPARAFAVVYLVRRLFFAFLTMHLKEYPNL